MDKMIKNININSESGCCIVRFPSAFASKCKTVGDNQNCVMWYIKSQMHCLFRWIISFCQPIKLWLLFIPTGKKKKSWIENKNTITNLARRVHEWPPFVYACHPFKSDESISVRRLKYSLPLDVLNRNSRVNRLNTLTTSCLSRLKNLFKPVWKHFALLFIYWKRRLQ